MNAEHNETEDTATTGADTPKSATAAMMALIGDGSNGGKARITAYLLGLTTPENLHNEAEEARIRIAADAPCLPPALFAQLQTFGVQVIGAIAEVAALDPATRDAERAAELAAWGEVSPADRLNAVICAITYTKLLPLMKALAITPEIMRKGLKYASGEVSLCDLTGLAVDMAVAFEACGNCMTDTARAVASHDMARLTAALHGVADQTPDERARERALWMEAVNAGRVGIAMTGLSLTTPANRF